MNRVPDPVPGLFWKFCYGDESNNQIQDWEISVLYMAGPELFSCIQSNSYDSAAFLIDFWGGPNHSYMVHQAFVYVYMCIMLQVLFKVPNMVPCEYKAYT